MGWSLLAKHEPLVFHDRMLEKIADNSWPKLVKELQEVLNKHPDYLFLFLIDDLGTLQSLEELLDDFALFPEIFNNELLQNSLTLFVRCHPQQYLQMLSTLPSNLSTTWIELFKSTTEQHKLFLQRFYVIISPRLGYNGVIHPDPALPSFVVQTRPIEEILASLDEYSTETSSSDSPSEDEHSTETSSSNSPSNV